MRRMCLVFGLLMSACVLSWTDDPLSLSLYPGGDLPIASEFFNLGGGIALGGEYRLPFAPFISPRIELGYAYWPIWTGGALNVLSAGGGLSARLEAGSRIGIWANGSAGYYYGVLPEEAGGNLYVSGGSGVEFAVAPSLALGGQARYRWLSDGQGGSLFSGVGVSVGFRLTLLVARRLQLENLELRPVFPVL
jgi:hypothetical protein